MRVSSLGEGNLDLVEVFGGDGRLEDLLRLLEHLADVVAGGDVDEGEQLHVGLGGDGGGLADGRVAGFGGPLHLLLGEGGVMDEQVGVGRGGDGGGAGRAVAGDDDGAARTARSHHPVGRYRTRFAFDDLILTSKLIDGSFPDYHRVIPTNNDKMLEVDRKTFRDSVDRVSTISIEKSRAVSVISNSRAASLATDVQERPTRTSSARFSLRFFCKICVKTGYQG